MCVCVCNVGVVVDGVEAIGAVCVFRGHGRRADRLTDRWTDKVAVQAAAGSLSQDSI